MNNQLGDLLRKTSGIIHSPQGIHSKKIDPTEYQDLLYMKSAKTDVAVGNWVQVKRGIYKGDVGQIATTHAWGIDLYLVPRIPTENDGNTLKRKASTVIPEPVLFCPKNSNLNAIHHPDGTYRIGRLIFEHGLLIKSFDYHSISPQVSEIPLKLFTQFSSSSLPDILLSSLPRPQEWKFSTGDNVVIYPSKKKGIIESINSNFAEVEIPEEGLHCVPWHNIRKHFKIGDFVCVLSGPGCNTKGWVIDVDKNVATIASKKIEGEINNCSTNTINVGRCKTAYLDLTMFTDHRHSFEPSYRYVNTFSTYSQNPAHFFHIPAYKTTQASLVRNRCHYF